MKPVFTDELVRRTTIEQEIMNDPERLLAYIAVTSLAVLAQAKESRVHYRDFVVSAVAPVYDKENNPKILAASNYRPRNNSAPNRDIRVCAEQALIDNSVHEDDLTIGALFVRGPKPDPNKLIEGCREGMRSLHLCRPCRGRVLETFDPELSIVTFIDEDPEPSEAMTLGQMLGYHDVMTDYPELPAGKSARDVALEVLSNTTSRKNIKKPRVQKRRMRPEDRDPQ